MKRLIILLPFLVLLACGKSEISPSDTFVKYYGGDATYELKDMIVSQLGASETIVLLCNKTNEFDTTHMYLFEVSLDGRLLNEVDLTERDLAGLHVGQERASRIFATSTGYLVVGTQDLGTASSDPYPFSNAIWGELDQNFNLVGAWQKVGSGTTANYVGSDILLLDDGGVLVAGYTNVNGDNDFFYNKIGGANPTWSRIQNRPSSNDQLFRVVKRTDGGFGLIGTTEIASGDGEGGINVERTIVDANGIIQNSLVYGITVGANTDFNDVPYDLFQIPSGYAIVGTSNNSFPFLMIVNMTGAFIQEVEFSDEFLSVGASGVVARGIARTRNNDYFIVGSTGDFNELGGELMMMRTDQLGGIINIGSDPLNPDRQWKNLGLINGNEQGVKVIRATDGSLYVGATYDFGGDLTQIALLKINDMGELKP